MNYDNADRLAQKIADKLLYVGGANVQAPLIAPFLNENEHAGFYNRDELINLVRSAILSPSDAKTGVKRIQSYCVDIHTVCGYEDVKEAFGELFEAFKHDHRSFGDYNNTHFLAEDVMRFLDNHQSLRCRVML